MVNAFMSNKNNVNMAQELFNNDEYINWLINFMNNYSFIADINLLYFPEELTRYDGEKIANLKYFYYGIDNYASRNFIYPNNEGCYINYNLKKNDVCLQIGIICGVGTSFYVKCVDEADVNNIINFDDIKNNKDQNVTEINNALNDITNIINNYYENDIPFRAMKAAIDVQITALEEKEKTRCRTNKN